MPAPTITPGDNLTVLFGDSITLYSDAPVTWSLNGQGELTTVNSTTAIYTPDNLTARVIVTATAGDSSTTTRTIIAYGVFPITPDNGTDGEEVEERASMKMEDGRLITALAAPAATELTLRFTGRRRAEYQDAYDFVRRNPTSDFYVRDQLGARLYFAKCNGNLKFTHRLTNLVNFELPIYAIQFSDFGGGYGVSPYGYSYGN